MKDKKHNLKEYNNQKTVAFVTFADGVRFSDQPPYKIYSLIEAYLFIKDHFKVATTTVALIFNEVMKNNG